MSRFLIIELEGGLPECRYVGLFHALRLHEGVRSLTDLSAITQDTLDSYLMQPEPTVPLVVPERVEQLEMLA